MYRTTWLKKTTRRSLLGVGITSGCDLPGLVGILALAILGETLSWYPSLWTSHWVLVSAGSQGS